MKAVHKYEIKVGDQYIETLGAPRPLGVAFQGDKLFMWVLGHKESTSMLRVSVVGTGWDIEESGDYVGTVHDAFAMVWHVFTS